MIKLEPGPVPTPFPSLLDVTGRSGLFPELELDYVSRPAFLAVTHWMLGMLGFVVLEVEGVLRGECSWVGFLGL